jgi:hypothetical protein
MSEKTTTFPYTHTVQDNAQSKYNIHVYLKANKKTFTRLDAPSSQDTLNTSLAHKYGKPI